jgi:hypothetical protein
MKRKILIMAGIGLMLAFSQNNSQAQTTNVPVVGPAPIAPSPLPPGQRFPGPRTRQPRVFIPRVLNDLRMMKAQLQRSQDDFGGHKDSAIEACDKALLELDAVLKASPPLPSPQQTGQPLPGGTVPPPLPLRVAPSVPPAPSVQPAPPQP